MGYEKCPSGVPVQYSGQIAAHTVHHKLSLTEVATNHSEVSFKLSFNLRGSFSQFKKNGSMDTLIQEHPKSTSANIYTPFPTTSF